MKKKITYFFLLLFCSISLTVGGTKEEIIRLQSDVLQLQNQMRLLHKSMDDRGEILKSLLEQLNDQVAASNVLIESMIQVRQTQQVKDADLATSIGQLSQAIQNLNLKWDETNNRIAALHQKMEANQLHVSSLRRVPSVEGGMVPQADHVYAAVFNDYLMGNYDLAIAGFQDFLISYENSEYSDNALYYLAICYSKLGRHEQGIQTFNQVINLYPKADMAPQAYFKKALALLELQKNADAIETLKKLAVIFPDSQEAIRARQELETLGVELPETTLRR